MDEEKTGIEDVVDQDTLDDYVENIINAEEARENN